MKNLALYLLVVSIVLCIPPQIRAYESIQKSTDQTVSIGKSNRFSLFGYSSPLAYVSLSSIETIAQTRADKNGFYSFDSVSVPMDTKEICIQSIDTHGDVSQPSCIAFNELFIGFDVGPILLAPTIVTNSLRPEPKIPIIISGQTLPNAPVYLSAFIDKHTLTKGRGGTAEPFTQALSTIETQSDANGSYSFSYTSSSPQTTRVYTSARYKSSPTGKSTTLSLSMDPLWLIALRILIKALLSLIDLKMSVLILIESLIVLYLLTPILLPKKVQIGLSVYHPAFLARVINKLALANKKGAPTEISQEL